MSKPREKITLFNTNRFPIAVLKYMLTYLPVQSVNALSQTCSKKNKSEKEVRELFDAILQDKKTSYDIAHELLEYVLDGNPEGVKAYFDKKKENDKIKKDEKEKNEKTEICNKRNPKPDNTSLDKCSVLTRTFAREELIREPATREAPDPAETFLSFILNKICQKTSSPYPPKIIVVCKRRWDHISPLEAAAICGDNFLVKILLEQVPSHLKKEAASQLQGVLFRSEHAENGSHLAPYKVLIKAYEDFISQYKNHSDPQYRDALNKQWIQGVGRCLRQLPTYGLQEYCDVKLYRPLPEFNLPPPRSYLLVNDDPVEPGEVRIDYSLDKHYKKTKMGNWLMWGHQTRPQCRAKEDLAAFKHFVHIRTTELGKITQSLLASLPTAVDPKENVSEKINDKRDNESEKLNKHNLRGKND